jgi:hypothetical protein
LDERFEVTVDGWLREPVERLESKAGREPDPAW